MSTDTTTDRLGKINLSSAPRFPRRLEPPDLLFDPPHVNYPARDGRPMADNTLQADWMRRLHGGLETQYREDPNVFIASNLMWYPVQGKNRRRLAPDVMVVFGRPKGYRDSYVQHLEGGLAPQVAVEILSPGNRKRAMDFKRRIYEKYGVVEYYVYDPYKIRLEVWLKEGEAFRLLPDSNGWVSPLMGIRFDLGDDLTVIARDGRPFLDHAEVAHQRDLAQLRADEERLRADEEQARRVEADRKAERMAARLRALGLDPDE